MTRAPHAPRNRHRRRDSPIPPRRRSPNLPSPPRRHYPVPPRHHSPLPPSPPRRRYRPPSSPPRCRPRRNFRAPPSPPSRNYRAPPSPPRRNYPAQPPASPNTLLLQRFKAACEEHDRRNDDVGRAEWKLKKAKPHQVNERRWEYSRARKKWMEAESVMNAIGADLEHVSVTVEDLQDFTDVAELRVRCGFSGTMKIDRTNHSMIRSARLLYYNVDEV